MSDMSPPVTFTLRDLSRRTAEVLAAMRKYGHVEVRSRSGEVILLTPKVASSPKSKKEKVDPVTAWEAEMKVREQRMIDAGFVPPKPGEWDEERFNRIIAGEE
jgi:hypothetical protein